MGRPALLNLRAWRAFEAKKTPTTDTRRTRSDTPTPHRDGEAIADFAFPGVTRAYISRLVPAPASRPGGFSSCLFPTIIRGMTFMYSLSLRGFLIKCSVL